MQNLNKLNLVHLETHSLCNSGRLEARHVRKLLNTWAAKIILSFSQPVGECTSSLSLLFNLYWHVVWIEAYPHMHTRTHNAQIFLCTGLCWMAECVMSPSTVCPLYCCVLIKPFGLVSSWFAGWIHRYLYLKKMQIYMFPDPSSSRLMSLTPQDVIISFRANMELVIMKVECWSVLVLEVDPHICTPW